MMLSAMVPILLGAGLVFLGAAVGGAEWDRFGVLVRLAVGAILVGAATLIKMVSP